MTGLVQSEIPKIFFSSKTKKQFKHCVMCEKSLLKNGTNYMIEKAFSQDVKTGEKDMIFEYAICTDCHAKMSKDISKKSLERLKMYFDLYVNFEERDQELFNKSEEVNINDWISTCVISKKSVKNLKEFQIAALCYEDKIMYGNLPFAIGYEATDEMQELLSKETKEILDGFKDYAFPPDVWDKIPDDRLILV